MRLGYFTLLCAFLVLVLVSLSACASERQPPTASTGKLKVLATTTLVGDVVQHIGGEKIDLHVLLPVGADPHSFEPTPQDIAYLAAAEVVFANGAGLEEFLSRLMENVSSESVLISLSDGLDLIEAAHEAETAEGHAHENGDPHVWMDPRAWSAAAGLIAEKLIAHDPAGEPVFRRNLATLKARIAALDAYAERAIATIPERQRVLVTAHDAFNYFARRYGIEVLGIQGLSTESEAGVRRIQELVDVLVERRIPAVFVETSVSDRNVLALVEGAAARGHRVVVGGSLFSDAMGDPGSYEGTYVGMIDHNVTTIVRALGGTAPERGFQNRLGTRR